MNKKFGAFSSSANPQEFSQTIGSIIKILAYGVSAFSAMKGINFAISDAQTQQIADAFTVIATAGMTIWQSGELLYGLIRRITNKEPNTQLQQPTV